MAGTFGNLGVLLFSLLIGGLVTTVGYTPFFVALAVLDILGAILLWTLVKDPGRPGPRPGHGDDVPTLAQAKP